MFDRYAQAAEPSWGRRALIIASIFLHGSAAIALAIYSVFHVEEIAPPAVSLTFFSAPPPPPPPPPPAHKKTTPTEHKIIPTNIVQPTKVVLVQPKKEEEKKDENDGEEGGVEGGVKGGQVGGTVGGVVGGTIGGTGTDLNGKPGGTSQMVASMTLQCNKPNPHLPEAFLSSHPGQKVRGTYKIYFDASGKVLNVETMVGVQGQDAAIIQQIKSTWQCKPSKPLPLFHTVFPIDFKIN